MVNLSIRGKLLLLFSVAVVTTVIIILINIYSSYELADREVEKAQQLMLEGQKEKIKVATSAMAEALAKAVSGVSEDKEKIEIFRNMIKDAFFEQDSSGYFFVYEGTTNVAHPVKPSLHGKDLNNLKGKDGVYSVRELARAAESGGGFVHFTWDKPGKAEPMPKLGYAQMIPGTDFWIGTGVYIDNIDSRAAEIRQAMMDAGTRTILIQLGAAAALFLFLMLPMNMVVSRNIINPLVETKEAARKVAAGNLDMVLTSKNHDEIGELQEALSAMAASLRKNISDMAQKERETARKAEEAEKAGREAMEAHELAQGKTAELLEAAHMLEDVVESISSASEQLMAQIEQSSAGAVEQESMVEATAASTAEISATVAEVAHNAAGAAEAVDEVRKMAEKGAEVVNRAVDGIGTVAVQSRTLMDDMSHLGQLAEGIGAVINVINDIADQTNLLALNAAIEAARAGDAGRGFAVVADEVRKLAEKTMSATSDVSSAVKDIQSETRKNIDNTVHSVETIAKVTEQANESGESLRQIVSLVEDATGQVHSIATAADQHSVASEEISQSITEINTISGETSRAMASSKTVVKDLAKQINTLTSLMVRMKA
ncbi:methyl-accepting chemotaxis protein [Maridesulfovibrio sp.]|uniref:methyl-accepting chemotaxis protein n=1 Tax=Maridesulfovibrio sp. TaxID=2795000 RepID=UPI002A186DB6|nr:methyl-accepting chemotaxis protein [Maridesulfovibrio sp.]